MGGSAPESLSASRRFGPLTVCHQIAHRHSFAWPAIWTAHSLEPAPSSAGVPGPATQRRAEGVVPPQAQDPARAVVARRKVLRPRAGDQGALAALHALSACTSRRAETFEDGTEGARKCDHSGQTTGAIGGAYGDKSPKTGLDPREAPSNCPLVNCGQSGNRRRRNGVRYDHYFFQGPAS